MKNLSRFAVLAVPVAAVGIGIYRFIVRSALPVAMVAAAAAAPNTTIVPADAKWMVYADFNVLRNSTLGKEIIATADKEMANSDSPVVPNIQKILTTVGSVTAYGTNFSEDPKTMDGTLVAQGTPDLRKIAESLLLTQTIASPEHVVEITDLGFPAYGLKQGPPRPKAAKAGKDAKDDGKDASDEPKKEEAKAAAPRDPNKIELIIAFPPEGIILVSKSKAQITRGRELFNGKGATLAKSSSQLKRFASEASDAYLFAASEAPPEKMYPADAPPARILKMTKAGAVTLGEHAAEAYAHLELIAIDDTTADKLMKIVQGLTAMLSMAETNDKLLGDFLNAAAVTRDGDHVILNLSYPSARLIEMVNNYKNSDRPQRNVVQGPYVSGKAAAKWNGAPSPAPADGVAMPEAAHVVENVELKTGSTLTFARNLNGARFAKFARVEVAPASGGAPLVFKAAIPGPRNSLSVEFPGADGNYNLNVVYNVVDPEGKVEYAVSVSDPRPAPAPKGK